FGSGHHAVAAKHEIGAAGSDTNGVNFIRCIGDSDVAVDRAALLREAGHVDDAGALAFQMRGHADDGADSDNAGAADAGDDDAVGMISQRKARAWQRRPVRRLGHAFALLKLRAMYGNEGRAEAVDAGIILIAA